MLGDLASQATPGAANVFQLHDDIVINEIMYSPAPELAIADALTHVLVDFGRLHDGHDMELQRHGAALPANWANQNYAVDNQNWRAGKGLIGYETSTLAYPVTTELAEPSTRDPRFATYYFQTTFNVTDCAVGQRRSIGSAAHDRRRCDLLRQWH